MSFSASALRTLLLATAVMLPAAAHAGSVVLPPLIPIGGVEARHVSNLTALMASELDFMSDVSRVIEISDRPANLNTACLSNSSCLGAVARGGGGDRLLAGTLRATRDSFHLDLVLFDASAGHIIRRSEFTLPSSPERVADGMNAVMREIITGVSPAEAAEQAAPTFDFSSGLDDDFAFEEAPVPAAPIVDRRAEEEARRRAEEERQRAEQARREEEERRRRAEEQARREEEERRRRAEEQARREEEERRRRAEEQARREEEDRRRAAQARPAPPPPDDDDFDPSMISFGAAGEIQAEVVDEEPRRDTTREPARSSERSVALLDLDDLDDDRSRGRDRSRDQDRRSSSSARSSSGSRGGSSTAGRVDRAPPSYGETVHINLRGGYSQYYSFAFYTAGAEAMVSPSPGLYLVAGLEAYNTRRTPPPELVPVVGDVEWNAIFPVNAGLIYKIGEGAVKPYIGADVIFAQYYIDPTNTPSFSAGARVRGGVDLMVAANVGFNINLAGGFWQGRDWEVVQEGVGTAGLLPQISSGLLLAF